MHYIPDGITMVNIPYNNRNRRAAWAAIRRAFRSPKHLVLNVWGGDVIVDERFRPFSKLIINDNGILRVGMPTVRLQWAVYTRLVGAWKAGKLSIAPPDHPVYWGGGDGNVPDIYVLMPDGSIRVCANPEAEGVVALNIEWRGGDA
ncbi:MAG: hypothetical protein J7L56_03425 [Halomonas sp.]|nr:hypothetical protein [Halomonas sp.]MCD6437302.1 hypothetical protein [Halomonas sp.]